MARADPLRNERIQQKRIICQLINYGVLRDKPEYWLWQETLIFPWRRFAPPGISEYPHPSSVFLGAAGLSCSP